MPSSDTQNKVASPLLKKLSSTNLCQLSSVHLILNVLFKCR